MRTTRTLAPLLTLGLAAALAGCGGGGVDAHGRVSPGGSTSVPRAAQDTSLLTPYGLPVPTAGGSGSGGVTASAGGEDYAASGATAVDGTVTGPSVPLAAPGAATGAGGPADVPLPSAPGGPGATDPGNASLRAGFVDDNADFAAYQTYLDGYTGPSRDLPVTGRHVVTVTDPDGLPLLGAAVTIGSQTELSHVDGRTLFFGVAPGDPVSVTYAGATATGELSSDLGTTIAVDTARTTTGLTLDLDLVLDTTGSMEDEIQRLNTSLADIATRLDALPSHPTVRYALTVYKDHQDAYVFRSHDFTDLATFQAELSTTTADGGGDTPEALDEALNGAVDGPSWGQDTSSVEMMLLVSDAPSHIPGDGDTDGKANQTPADVPTYDQSAAAASRRGIEIVPLAASGTDDTAEHEFRQLAEHTLGTFFFLTYAADGTPGDGTTTHVKDYHAGDLADQVVGHVSDRLATYSVAVGTTPPPTPTPTPPNGN